MKLLLLEDVPNLGYFGDVVEVKDGYGRNYLLPHRIATVPTDAMIKSIEEERAKRAEERRMVRAALEKSAAKVADAVVRIEAKANDAGHLYGSVTEADIAKMLQESGYEVQTKHVAMGPHITELGEYDITLRFALDLKTKIKVNVVAPGTAEENAKTAEQSAEAAEEPAAETAEGNE